MMAVIVGVRLVEEVRPDMVVLCITKYEAYNWHFHLEKEKEKH